MAGGLGTRFWPISRAVRPKQFLDLKNQGSSFLRQTYDRMLSVIPQDNVIVVTLERYVETVKDILPEISDRNILVEPYNRDTAPCLAYASHYLLERDSGAVMIATPSDHLIPDTALFAQSVQKALDYATAHDNLVTLGVVPTRPDTNFGYIQVSGGAHIRFDKPVKVKTFTEKPDAETAAVFLQSGEFLWNSGIFITRASVILEEMHKHAPLIAKLWDGNASIFQIYTDCPRTSIDYAVMEKTDRAMVFPVKFKWADIGNWDTLYENVSDLDDSGNAVRVRGKILLKEDSNNLVFSNKDGKLVAIKGLDNMVVVDSEDVLMICPRNESEIKEFLSELVMPQFEEFR